MNPRDNPTRTMRGRKIKRFVRACIFFYFTGALGCFVYQMKIDATDIRGVEESVDKLIKFVPGTMREDVIIAPAALILRQYLLWPHNDVKRKKTRSAGSRTSPWPSFIGPSGGAS